MATVLVRMLPNTSLCRKDEVRLDHMEKEHNMSI